MIRHDTHADAYSDLTNAMRPDLLRFLVILWRRCGGEIVVRDDPGGYGAWVRGDPDGRRTDPQLWLPDETVTALWRGGFVGGGKHQPLQRLRDALGFAATLESLREL